MSEIRFALVQERAYQLWMAEGCPEGKCDHHWLKAEQELATVLAAPVQVAAKAPSTRKAGPRGAAPRGRASRTAAGSQATH